ncbi:Cytochrome b2, mitochondrial precursor [Serendipita sp. 399]|nr:Cytochrome b2, mitochondrial precursor [Serendipita sp. 399]
MRKVLYLQLLADNIDPEYSLWRLLLKSDELLGISIEAREQAVLKSVNDKSAQCQKQLDSVIREGLERDLELERRKNREQQDQLREKDKEYARLKSQYDQLKRKALLAPGAISNTVAADTALHLGDSTRQEGTSRSGHGVAGLAGFNALTVNDVVNGMEAGSIQRTPLRGISTGTYTWQGQQLPPTLNISNGARVPQKTQRFQTAQTLSIPHAAAGNVGAFKGRRSNSDGNASDSPNETESVTGLGGGGGGTGRNVYRSNSVSAMAHGLPRDPTGNRQAQRVFAGFGQGVVRASSSAVKPEQQRRRYIARVNPIPRVSPQIPHNRTFVRLSGDVLRKEGNRPAKPKSAINSYVFLGFGFGLLIGLYEGFMSSSVNLDALPSSTESGNELRMLTLEEVQKHNSEGSVWVIIGDKVYEELRFSLTDFVRLHPGGADIILRHAGKDVNEIFNSVHSPTVLKMLSPEQCVGTIDVTQLPSRQRELEEQRRIERAREAMPPLSAIVNLHDFERVAKQVLSSTAWAYYSSAAEDEAIPERGTLSRPQE